jgi:UrcA family protein
MKRLIAIIVGCAVMGSAVAQDRVVIDYSKMDLTTPAGASALYLRIVNAADAVCPQDQARGLRGRLESRKCVRNAVVQAVKDVHNPLLTAQYHGAAGGRLYSSRATIK